MPKNNFWHEDDIRPKYKLNKNKNEHDRSILLMKICYHFDLECYRFTHLLHQHPPERMSIGVLPSNLDHPIGGDVSFFHTYSHVLMLFDHLFCGMEIAELEVFEMVLGVDERQDVTLK